MDNEPDFFGQAFNTELFFNAVKDVKIATGEITTDVKKVKGEIVITSAETTKSFSEATAGLNKYVSTAVLRYRQLGLVNKEEIEKSQKLGETQEEFAKRLEIEAVNRITNISNLGNSIIGTEQQIETFLKTAIELNQQIDAAIPEARVAVFINESQAVIEQANIEIKERQRLLGLLRPTIESEAEFRLRTEQELLAKFPEFEKLSAKQRLVIIDDYYAKLKEKRGEDAADAKLSREEQLEGIADGLRQIAVVAQTGVQVFQQYIQTQLTLLAAEEERLLDKVVGDSEEANEKRLEIQEDYEEQRKEITKRGQLAQLQLTRLQALANVAEAVTKALAEGPIIGQILAGISAAIGLVQVGVISTQISATQSLARGGLLNGPSHENGGIRLAGGGVVAEGGEAVINRRASIDYRGLLSEANMSSGGAPLVNSAFDDTRLIEAISRQNRNPIKAYVLEQDITRSQGVNKRLQQLSKI